MGAPLPAFVLCFCPNLNLNKNNLRHFDPSLDAVARPGSALWAAEGRGSAAGFVRLDIGAVGADPPPSPPPTPTPECHLFFSWAGFYEGIEQPPKFIAWLRGLNKENGRKAIVRVVLATGTASREVYETAPGYFGLAEDHFEYRTPEQGGFDVVLDRRVH